MATNCSNQLTQRYFAWIKTRQAILVLFQQFSNASSPNPANSQRLSHLLVDYLSSGHFGLFEGFLKAQEQTQHLPKRLYTKLMFQITSSTEKIMAFYDKYHASENLETLGHDLNHLGPVFANRLDWEDQLSTAFLHTLKSNNQSKIA